MCASLRSGESNVEGMLDVLFPLHDMMEKQGPTTLKEIAFVQVRGGLGCCRAGCDSRRLVLSVYHSRFCLGALQAYGHELEEAFEWCRRYRVSRKESDLHQAWDLYYHVFKRINKQLPSLVVSEALLHMLPKFACLTGLQFSPHTSIL